MVHPWVQKIYPILGLGSGGRPLRHFQTPVLYWINFSLRVSAEPRLALTPISPQYFETLTKDDTRSETENTILNHCKKEQRLVEHVLLDFPWRKSMTQRLQHSCFRIRSNLRISGRAPKHRTKGCSRYWRPKFAARKWLNCCKNQCSRSRAVNGWASTPSCVILWGWLNQIKFGHGSMQASTVLLWLREASTSTGDARGGYKPMPSWESKKHHFRAPPPLRIISSGFVSVATPADPRGQTKKSSLRKFLAVQRL